MSSSESRFTSQNKSTEQRVSTNTVGLVALSDYRKRRAEVFEQQEREAREAASANATPDRSLTATPDNSSDPSIPRKKPKKKAAKAGRVKLSFGGGDEDEADEGVEVASIGADGENKAAKFKVNSSVSVVPRSVTKSALRREVAERDALRRQFLVRQEAVKMTEIAIPFVFYDGSNIPGGTVRAKKGDFVWVFLDKSRKVGADLGVGEKANARREWARVGVDDLMMVRGNVIIPHHYEFLFFIMNKTVGPTGQLLFEYSAEIPKPRDPEPPNNNPDNDPDNDQEDRPTARPTSTQRQPDVASLEGATGDPAFTKVVDRRWYERNKHIYPASVWQDFDPEKDYQSEVRRDLGGNTFFYS
ncbi:Uu.00g054620.m01.CDS01 [Anthostomella pinea]|uniref:Uu.00g054620.m01.CDS01 n=1 Tax=Anthostomella pinea TaxID=933095 RepID=A0AAI8VWP1_9PEZI|nr:Uu.00g054620.m01.CDS01 [Anthostomella pinea]